MAFLGGGMAWLFVFLVIPSALLLLLAFAARGEYGEILFYERADDGSLHWLINIENFRRLAGYGILGWSPDYLWILWRTVLMASVTTFLCVVAAYLVAFFIALRPPRSRYLWLIVVVIPLCTNLVIRTYGWQLIFSAGLPPARLAAALGYIEPGRPLYPSELAMYIGLFTSSLPFAVLPLYTNVERLDWSLVEAASDLYSTRWGIFRHAIVPQTVPGLLVAVILTFIPSMGVFVVPDLLGGAKYMMLGNLIQQQFGSSRDFPFGATISFGLVLLTLPCLFLLRRQGRGVDVA